MNKKSLDARHEENQRAQLVHECEVSNFACTHCGKIMSDYGEVRYDGPADDHGKPDLENEDRGWDCLDWITWCNECFEKWEKANAVRTEID